MPRAKSEPAASRDETVHEIRRQVIEHCVRTFRLVGLPRSVGEIFGFIFGSTHPVTFEDVVRGLSVSAGSVSHGIRSLRRIGAIRPIYVARDRRDFYVAETSFSAFVKGFLAESLLSHLSASCEDLGKLRETLRLRTDQEVEALSERLDLLLDWHEQARAAMRSVLTSAS
ncbi:MAG: hypothetical protein ABI680_03370 [Chthoniobacteraceae bacterium]